MQLVATIVTLILVVVVFVEVWPIASAYMRARAIIENTKPYVRDGGTQKTLIVGDSTGYGTGATYPEDSIAGQVGTHYPNASVENMSRNGMKIDEALAVVRALPRDARYDLLVLQIGGNDIIYFSSRTRVKDDLNALLSESKMRAADVVFLSSGNIGAAPAFGPILSWVMDARTRIFRELYIQESKNAGVIYVDLFVERAHDPFVLEPWRYHSADGLHPSSEGYALWFEKVQQVLP